MSLNVDRCKSCGTKIVWAVTERGKAMPIDVDRSLSGTLVLFTEVFVGTQDAAGPYHVRAATTEERASHAGNLWISHFATCTNATFHRKGGDL